jgi:3-oxosteroid 1-dehydrogenase
VPFRYADGYADYYPDAPGGSARGRTIEARPYDTRRLGAWASRLRPGMSTGLGLIGYGPELSAMSYYNRAVPNLLTAARVLARTVAGRARRKTLVGNGAALVGRLLELALARGAEVWTEAPVRELLTDDGAVVGAMVQHEGADHRIHARHGVLLAAGGFSRNAEMREKHGGDQATSARWSIANPGDTGEVLAAAMGLGAATDLLDEAIWLPVPCMPDGRLAAYSSRKTSAFGRARWRPGSVIVDADGQRFADEAVSYTELGKAMFARDQKARAVPSWLVFDDAFRRRCLFGVLPGRLPEQWLTDGFVLRADTLEELAGRCGVDLAETCRRMGEYAKTGVDEEFHRGENAYDRYMGDPRQQPNNCLAPIRSAPFYAVAVYPADVGTCGGLITDEAARVISTAGVPITGLYATGNITASIQGRHYLGAGGSIAPSCTFGYVAANAMADLPAAAS